MWFETGYEGLDWIFLAEDKDQWRAVMNTVMNLLASQNSGNFLTNWTTISSLKKDSAPWSEFVSEMIHLFIPQKRK